MCRRDVFVVKWWFLKNLHRSGEATELLLKSTVLPANTMETNEGEL
jgi:hypothetical protein